MGLAASLGHRSIATLLYCPLKFNTVLELGFLELALPWPQVHNPIGQRRLSDRYSITQPNALLVPQVHNPYDSNVLCATPEPGPIPANITWGQSSIVVGRAGPVLSSEENSLTRVAPPG